MKGKPLILIGLASLLGMGMASTPSFALAGESSRPASVSSANLDACTVSLNSPYQEIAVEGTFQIVPASSKGETSFSYESLDPSIASVSETGLVTGISAGSAAIRVSSSTDYTFLRVKVLETNAPKIEGLLDVSLPDSSLTLFMGQEYALSPMTKNEGRTIEAAAYSYASSDPSVASVDSSGLVKGIASGSAQITVTSTVENVSASTSVEITVRGTSAFLVRASSLEEVTVNAPIDLDVVLMGFENGQWKTLADSSSLSYSVDDATMGKVEVEQGVPRLYGYRKGNIDVTASINYGGASYSQTFTYRVRERYTVSFYSGANLLHQETLLDGERFSYAETPSAAGKTFASWSDGSSSYDRSTPIESDLSLQPAWLVYGDDLASEKKQCVYEYSSLGSLSIDNLAGAYFWEDYHFPLAHVQFTMKNATSEAEPEDGFTYNVILPAFPFSDYPAVSFYLGGNFDNEAVSYVPDDGDAVTSSAFHSYETHQVSIKNGTIWFDGADTGAAVKSSVLSGNEGLAFQITNVESKKATDAKGNTYYKVKTDWAKMNLSGFYAHLVPEE